MQRYGRFEVSSKIGVGGFGVVYKGFDPSLNRHAAIKVMSEVGMSQPQYVARFQREAQAVAALNHPNIVQVYELGDQDGLPFMALEFLDGRDLNRVLAAGEVIPPDKVVDLVSQVASGLEYAHGKSIVHRDIKASNLRLLADGTIKIMDFGLAAMPMSDLTKTGELFGSIAYMSPEQVHGQKVDGRSDLYSLGVVFYEMLCRRRAFLAETQPKVLMKVLNELPAPITTLDGSGFEWLQPIVFKCLQKSADDRFESCQELIDTLKLGPSANVSVAMSMAPVEPAVAIADPPSSQPEPAWKRPLVLAPAVAVLGLLAAFALTRGDDQPTSVATPLAPTPVVAESTPSNIDPDAAMAMVVDKLVSEGAALAAEGYWTSPSGQCALDKYRAVLGLDPASAAAKDGLKSVQEHFLALGDELLAEGDVNDARRQFVTARGVLDDPDVEQRMAEIARRERKADRAADRKAEARRELDEQIDSAWRGALQVATVESLQRFLTDYPAASPALRREAETLLASVRSDDEAYANAHAEGTASSYERYLARSGRMAHADEARARLQTLPAPVTAAPVLVPPIVTNRVAPRYPDQARRRGREGTVVVNVAVDANGKVERAIVVDGADPSLDRAAVDAVKRWSFAPATLNGQPVAGELRLNVNFTLN